MNANEQAAISNTLVDNKLTVAVLMAATAVTLTVAAQAFHTASIRYLQVTSKNTE
jgi:hypothetical protein